MSQFSYRSAKPEDAARCAALFRADGVRGALLDAELLAQLLEQRLLVGACVFEERSFDGSATIRGCGMSGLVTPEIAARARRGEIPKLTDTLLYSQRGPAPMLQNRAAQARLNAADETHLVMLNFVIDDAPGAPVAEIHAVCNKAFLESHSGYGLRSYLMEVNEHERKGAMHRQSALTAGCQQAPTTADSGTQLFFLERDMFFHDYPFHPLRFLFLRHPPSLGLSLAQQDLLELALRGSTDHEIALELGIAHDTVRKRWRAIFERAERAHPGLFGNGAPAGRGTVRGTEKRRPLLAYLQEHAEELRPWPHHS